MRALLIKNNGEKIVAVTDWDGDSHINVPKNHTIVLSDDPKMIEGRTVDIKSLQAVAKTAADARAAAQVKAEADSKARRLAAAKALVGDPAAPAA